MSTHRSPRRVGGSLWLVGLVAFALYVPAAHWGAPHATAPERTRAWGVDDETPLGPLAEMHNIIEPKADRNLGYPLGFSFMAAAAYAPYMAALWLRGELGTPSGAFPYGLADPVSALRHLTWIAHALSSLMAAVAVMAIGDTARTLLGLRGGLLASAFAALAFPMFYYARTGNPDMPMLCFVCLTLAAFARSMEYGFTLRRALALGAFAGLALATKEQAFASFLLLPFALLVPHLRALPDGAGVVSWAFWRAPLAGLSACVLVFGCASGLFVDPERFFAHLAFGAERAAALRRGEIAFAYRYPWSLDGQVAWSRAFLGYLGDTFTGPGVLLALLGGVGAVAARSRAAWLVLPFASYVLVLFAASRTLQLRYLLALIPSLAVLAAWSVERALSAERPALRAVGISAALLVVGLGALRGLDLTHAMLRDSRFAAGEWLAQRAVAGDRVDHFGVTDALPPLGKGVEAPHATPFLGGSVEPRVDDAIVREIAASWAARRPEFVVLVPDYTSVSGRPYSRSCPAEVWEGLLDGRFGYELAARFETPRLLPWLPRPALDYPAVNPIVHVFVPREAGER